MSKFTERQTPPEDPDEHRYIWAGVEKAHQLWNVFGPVAKVIQDWRWWATAAALTLWLYRTDVAAALVILTGAGQ